MNRDPNLADVIVEVVLLTTIGIFGAVLLYVLYTMIAACRNLP